MAAVASNLLSSICSTLSKLRSSLTPPSSSSPGLGDIQEELEKLKKLLLRIQAVLTDAGEREIRDESVKLWLKELKDVAYDAEDVLEEYYYEQIRFAVAGAGWDERKRDVVQVCDLASTLLELCIPQRIRKIRETFEDISKDREALRLIEGDAPRCFDPFMNPQRQQTSSHVDGSGVFGRKQGIDEVIEVLISSSGSCKFTVVPIVGMGGLGKTTLAQLIYHDPRVCQYFHSMAWVCVSDNFDVARITNEIIESITGKSPGVGQLNNLQDILKMEIKGKRVLIVLDDVWNEQQEPWDSLRAPFCYAETVGILITTRNSPVADLMRTMPPYYPHLLSHEQSWLLFKHIVFGDRDPDDFKVAIGHKIIEKCQGLPLSVKTIGGLLRYELSEDRWTQVLESDLWDLDKARKEILPALMLSYHRLPAHLKPCLIYSSLFPKDYRFFAKTRLVNLWIAQGFVAPCANKSLEDIGSKYFDELHGRSLFQLSKSNHCFDKQFVLHDLIHDLARSLSNNEYYSITSENQRTGCNIPKGVRHLYVGSPWWAPESIDNPLDLRTLIVESKLFIPGVMNLDGFALLRSVELNHLEESQEFRILPHRQNVGTGFILPSVTAQKKKKKKQKISMELTDLRVKFSVGIHKHLRHLSLLYPYKCSLEQLNHLYSLQRMEIKQAISFRNELSFYTSNLFNLRYLEVAGNKYSLQALINVEEDRMAQLIQRCSAPTLADLEKLRPYNNFIELFTESHVDVPALPQTSQHLRISSCSQLISATQLQNLFTLKRLHLENFKEQQFWPWDMLPPNLEELRISRCRKLTSMASLRNLSSLRILYLADCDRLTFSQEESLPSCLQYIHICACLEMENLAGLRNMRYLMKLELIKCPLLQISPAECMPTRPHHVLIYDCPRLNEWCQIHQFDYTDQASKRAWWLRRLASTLLIEPN